MNRKPLLFILSLLTIFTLLLGGCAPAAPAQPAKLVFTDDLGRTISLAGTPKTIISMAPSNTELLYAVGAGPQVVAHDDFSEYPAEVKNLPSIGGSMSKYSLEKITALKPDLILAAEINTPEQIKSLEDLHLTVYYLKNPKDLDGLYTNITTVGKLTGHNKEAAELVSKSKTRVESIIKNVKTGQTPKVFYEVDGSNLSQLWTVGKGTFIDLMITMAGGTNVGAAAGDGWPAMSQEALIAANPDIIILGDAAYGTTADQVVARAGWDKISAVQNHRIDTIDDDLVTIPGPRLVDGLESLVTIINK